MKLQTRYPKIKFKFFPLDTNTRGAAETINICLQSFLSEFIICPIVGPEVAKKIMMHLFSV